MSVFSLINSNLLIFWLPDFCCENSCISWPLPYLFRAVPQSYLRDCLPGISPQQIFRIKRSFQILGYAFFFSVNTSSFSEAMKIFSTPYPIHPWESPGSSVRVGIVILSLWRRPLTKNPVWGPRVSRGCWWDSSHQGQFSISWSEEVLSPTGKVLLSWNLQSPYVRNPI